MRLPDFELRGYARSMQLAHAIGADETVRHKAVIFATDLVETELDEAERRSLGRRAIHSVRMGAQSTAIAVNFDDLQAAELLSIRYRDVPFSGAPIAQLYAVRVGRLVYFWSDAEPEAYVWTYQMLKPRTVAFLADALATHLLLRSLPQTITMHAAALRHGDAAFALTGISTAGKSTTAFACLAAGCQLYSDERCIVTPGGVVAYPRSANLREGGIELLLADLPPGDFRDRLEPHRGSEWNGAHFDELTGGAPLPEPAPLRALFGIVGFSEKPQLRRISNTHMLELVEPAILCGYKGLDRVVALMRFLAATACYEVTLGTPYETARALMECVESGT